MLAAPGGRPFSSDEWLYEIKYDGYRCLAKVDSGRVELRTKSGIDCSSWYPELAKALSAISGSGHVIDGEVCVLDDIGRSDFDRLHARSARRRWYPGCHAVTLCAFDLLFEKRFRQPVPHGLRVPHRLCRLTTAQFEPMARHGKAVAAAVDRVYPLNVQ